MPRPGRAAAGGRGGRGPPPPRRSRGARCWQEPRSDRVRERDLALPGWPAALDGLRVALVSDLHAGAPHVREERIERLVAAVNARRPDLVLLLGDYIDPEVALGGPRRARARSPRASARCARRSASSPCSATTTGHDDGPGMRAALRDAGITGARERRRADAGDAVDRRRRGRCATAARTSGAPCATCPTARP